jgi:hypothetical protein
LRLAASAAAPATGRRRRGDAVVDEGRRISIATPEDADTIRMGDLEAPPAAKVVGREGEKEAAEEEDDRRDPFPIPTTSAPTPTSVRSSPYMHRAPSRRRMEAARTEQHVAATQTTQPSRLTVHEVLCRTSIPSMTTMRRAKEAARTAAATRK